jgi:hypothetical protein
VEQFRTTFGVTEVSVAVGVVQSPPKVIFGDTVTNPLIVAILVKVLFEA